MVKAIPLKTYIPLKPEEVTTNPYDIIEEKEQEILRKNPKSYVHVILPLGEEDKKHERAKKALMEFIQKGVFTKQDSSFYLYKQSNYSWSQRGLIGGFGLKDYEEGRIKKHEKTREKPLQDRIKHIQTTEADTELVWLILKSNKELKKIFDETEKTETILDFEKYGWRNKLWKIPNRFEKKIIKIFDSIELYIADGHHRMEASYQNMKKMEEKKGEGNWSYILAYVANDDEIRILPYNRIIRKLPMNFDEFLREVDKKFKIIADDSRPKKNEICMFHEKWYKLIPKEISKDTVESLDSSILQEKILGPILNIKDPRKDPNIFFVGGMKNLETYAKEGNALIFSLYPTSVRDVENVADAKRDMPPKSTWFDPKLLSGLVVYLFY